MSIADKLTTITENVPKIYEAGKLAALESAEVLQGKLFGNPVTATAVTPITHNTGARLESKNLFSLASICGKANVSVEDGVITQLQADTTDVIRFKIQGYNNDTFVGELHGLKDATNIGVISFTFTKDNTFNRIRFGLNGVSLDSLIMFDVSFLRNGTYTLSANVTNITQGSVSWKNMQLELGSVATPYTPYVSDFTKVRTRNLFPFLKDYIRTSSSGSAKVLEVLSNGAIFQGIYVESASRPNSWDNGWGVFGEESESFYLHAEQTVTISADYTVLEAHELRTGHEEIGIWFYGNNAQYADVTRSIPSEIGQPTRVTATYTVHATGYYWPIFTLNSNKVKIENIQIEYGSEATPYVPYTIPAVVTKRGRNLSVPCDTKVDKYENFEFSLSDNLYTVNFDGTEIGSGNPGIEGQAFTLPAGTYTYSLQYVSGTATKANSSWAGFRLKSDGSTWVCVIGYAVATNYDKTQSVTFTLDEDTEIYFFATHAETNFSGYPTTNLTYRIMLEAGDTMHPYEPYIPPVTYPADADGNLGEVPSISPTMILECPDVEGVNIMAHYLKDIDGAFEERLAELEAAVVENA